MENERDNKPVPAQWLHLLNSSHIQRKLEQGPRLRAIFDSGRSPAALTEELYLTILSRFPTAAEMKIVEGLGVVQPARPPPAAVPAAQQGKAPPPAPGGQQVRPPAPKTVVVKRREDWVDLAWALINSAEFLYRH